MTCAISYEFHIRPSSVILVSYYHFSHLDPLMLPAHSRTVRMIQLINLWNLSQSTLSLLYITLSYNMEHIANTNGIEPKTNERAVDIENAKARRTTVLEAVV